MEELRLLQVFGQMLYYLLSILQVFFFFLGKPLSDRKQATFIRYYVNKSALITGNILGYFLPKGI